MQAELLKAHNVGMSADTRLTCEDLLALPDDGRRHEIIRGEHFVTPGPLRKHQMVVIQLGRVMADFLLEHRLGEVYTTPFDMILSNHDLVQPDLMVVMNNRLKLYAKYGVCEYWLADPEAETMEVYSPSESLHPLEHLGPQDVLKSPLLAGLPVRLHKLLHFEK